MIYEFAVHVDCPIRPQQIAKGSNKFVWGSNVKELDEGSKYFPFSASSKSLTVTALARTCRMVYHDLEVKPVFYRVNVFEFTDIKRIHPFIAAITPARRSSIRRINISSGDQSDVFPRNRISRKDRLGSRVVPLLLQCHDLRRLNLLLNDFEVRQLIWSSEKYYWHPRYEGDAGISLHLGLLLQWLGEPLNSDEPSLLNIPSLCVTYQRKSRYDLESHLQVIVGTQMDTVELQGNRAERARQLFGTEIAQIEAAMVSRRGLLDDKEKTMLVTDEQLKTSIAAAGLYFPGEERVSQDRTNSDIGAISSRTRNRCNKASLNDSYGIVEREVGKYDAEGLLTTGFRIHDLRTVDSFIECEISEYSWFKYDTVGSKSWNLFMLWPHTKAFMNWKAYTAKSWHWQPSMARSCRACLLPGTSHWSQMHSETTTRARRPGILTGVGGHGSR